MYSTVQYSTSWIQNIPSLCYPYVSCILVIRMTGRVIVIVIVVCVIAIAVVVATSVTLCYCHLTLRETTQQAKTKTETGCTILAAAAAAAAAAVIEVWRSMTRSSFLIEERWWWWCKAFCCSFFCCCTVNNRCRRRYDLYHITLLLLLCTLPILISILLLRPGFASYCNLEESWWCILYCTIYHPTILTHHLLLWQHRHSCRMNGFSPDSKYIQ